MKGEQKKYDDDDGRVICNMDVEGMRWHDKRRGGEQRVGQGGHPGDRLSSSEAWRYTFYSVLSGLFIVGVFAAVWIGFILFCTQVWFR